jgi:hypothetical protein
MRYFTAKALNLILLIFLVSPWLIMCASFSERGRLDSFEQTTKHYRLAMLMSAFEQAKYLSASDSPKDPAELKNFHVVSYNLKKIKFSNDKSKAYQTVEIEYYRMDSMRQKVIRDKQEWNYKPESEKWVLSSGLPQFK